MRDAILDCAQSMMRTEGVNALNLNEIARVVGIKPPSLYEYFDGKMAIYDGVFSRGAEQFGGSIASRFTSARDFASGCQAIFAAFLDFSRDSPELYRLLFEHPVPGFKPGRANLRQIEQGMQRGMTHMKELLARERLILPISAADTMLLVEIVLYGLTSRLLTTEPDVPFEQSRLRNSISALVTLIKSSSRRSFSP